MSSKIVLVSDDSDFFEYMRSKLELRKSDELFLFSFDSIIEKIHLLTSAVFIINSENTKEKTLDLLPLLKGLPIIIFVYNEDDVFKRKCYRNGIFDFMTILTSDADFRARMIPALSVSSLIEKNLYYREILANNKIVFDNNETFLDYASIIDNELKKIHNGQKKAVFFAISPNEQTKFLLKPTLIEGIILNNIRKNDILMNFASNKYFLFMFDIDLNSAQKIWQKISMQMSEKIYAGFCNVTNQKREQLINEVLNKLHQAMNADKGIPIIYNSNESNNVPILNNSYNNFKMFKQEFAKKIDQIIAPVFYQIQQKYLNKISGVIIEYGSGEGYGVFYIKGKHSNASFRISSPGFSKIHIDITSQQASSEIDTKRISLEPEELEKGLLEDLLEQFILEFKKG